MTNGLIELPWPPRELSPNARVHWTKKSKLAKQYRSECYHLTKMLGLTAPDGDILFCIEFIPPSKRRYDDDNCLGAFKAGRDGIADALGIDDNRFITQLRVSRESVPNGKVQVRISAYCES